jgi:glutamyl/glutaminyl-tRNA synthetase
MRGAPEGAPSPKVNLDALGRRLPARPITRFAPSPTGRLHLGHLVNAIYVWGLALALGGAVELRIEDHDRLRSRRDDEAGILDDLDWLSLVPDRPSIAEFRREGRCSGRQSDHPERYRAALARLTEAGAAYWCDCSRRRVLTEGGTAGGELRYDGRCRSRGLGPGPERSVRVRLDDGWEGFEDARLGTQRQNPSAQCGDLLVRDRASQWTYQFAVTVDDMADAVDLVVRGTDLLASTGRQIALARLLGRHTPPVFLHHPLALGPSGEKLSKSNRDTALSELRSAGLRPEDVIGRAAAAVGLIDAERPIGRSALPELLSSHTT